MVIKAIIGSRNFPNHRLHEVDYKVMELRRLWGNNLTILSGGASGVDQRVKQACLDWAEPVKFEEILPAFMVNHTPYRREDYLDRDTTIVQRAVDGVVAFWDGSSTGTAYVIRQCMRLHRNYEVIFG